MVAAIFKGRSLQTRGRIFQLHYFSFYPTLKFIEIGRSSTGCIFTKLNVWEYFQIDGFNELLRTIRMNETKRYKFRTPDAEATFDIHKTIVFIVKNISREETTLRFERKKICDCELKEIKTSTGVGSIRKYTYDHCPHRKLVELSVADETILPYSTTAVNIVISYTLYDTHEICYLMHLSHNRTIELYIEIVGLQSSQLSTFAQGFTFKMNDVYIGSLNPELQIYRFSNNTRAQSFYKINTEILAKYNEKWGFPVLICLNPEDIVNAKSIHAIQFLFSPITAGDIRIELPFKFGIRETVLTVIGSAKPYFVSPLEEIYFTELGKRHRKLQDLLITLSTEHIVLRSLPTHGTATRILTIKNISNVHTIGFTFDNYSLDGIVSTRIFPPAGFLLPSEKIPLILTVKSGGISCTIRISIACHLVNHTVFEEHLNTTSEFFQQTDHRYDMFCIEDDGVVKYPELPTVVITPAPKVFHRVITITCHIIPQVDIDTKMTVQDQMKQTPFQTLTIHDPSVIERFLIPRKQNPFLKGRQSTRAPTLLSQIEFHPEPKPKNKCLRKCCVSFTDEEFMAVHTVLSCLLDDNIFSKNFKHRVSLFQQRPAKYYSQMKVNLLSPEEEKEQVELITNKIPRRYLAETMQVLLSDNLLNYFRLGQYPPIAVRCDTGNQNRKRLSSGVPTNIYSEKFMFLFDK